MLSCGHKTDPEPKPAPVPVSSEDTGITYQLLVYSFCDSDGDGIGDFNGIASKLDYLKDLGVSAIWLSPSNVSTSYHGYDVEDYDNVNPVYGTEQDFKNLLDKSHEKGIRVYMDFVLNHSSRNHPWFLDAKKSEDSMYRDWYIFSSDPSADIKAGKIPMIDKNGYNSGEWTSVTTSGKKYYYHSFFGSYMPDINYGSADDCEDSEPFKALTASADKWINMGVDGFRLDAIKHIYHNATSDENPTFLRKFYDHCNATYKAAGHSDNIYMIGEHFSEASEVAPYYKGLPAYFEFSFWWRLIECINSGNASNFVATLQSYQKLYAQYRPDWIAASKLTNHDEDRAGELLRRNPQTMKLAAAVLLTAGRNPYIYQGEELGYWGSKSKGDAYVRTPMKWTPNGALADKMLSGQVDYSMLTPSISVETQKGDASSILNLYKTFGKARKDYLALSEGDLGYCPETAGNSSVSAWFRTAGGQKVLVVHNFSGGSVNINFTSSSLENLIVSNGSVTVSGSKLTLGSYSSAVFLQ